MIPVSLLLALLLTATPGEQYNRANEAYEAADYTQAVVLYDSAAARVLAAGVFYNRGNARFKLGQVGRAIADYLRAEVLDPHDPDIRHNLDFARAYRPDRTLSVPNPLVRFLVGLLRFLSLAAAKLLAGLLFLLAAAALTVLLVRRSRVGLWLAVGFGVLGLYCSVSWLSWAGAVSPHRAVVVVPELTLRSGPGPGYKDILIVHDGLEVMARERRGEYVLLQAPGGEGGWAETSPVEQVFPR